jgi:hypothetical protein
MSLRRALGPLVVFAATALGCSGTADSTTPDAASDNGRDSAAQAWPGTGDGGGADSQDGDATTRDEDATVGPGADGGVDSASDAAADALVDAALDGEADASADAAADSAPKDAAPADAQGDAPAGVNCGATICPSGEICCEEPAPVTGYCTPQCVVGPGCPLPLCKVPSDGGVVLDASSGDAAAVDAGPLTCSELRCPMPEACCMEPVVGGCAPKCVPSGLPCLACQ